MTFGHYVSPLTLAEASFSDLELLVFFVGHTWIWVITFRDSHLQRPLSLTWNWSCSSSFWQGLWYGYIFDVNGRADHKQDVCQFLEVVGVHGRSNTPKIEPKTRHAPLLNHKHWKTIDIVHLICNCKSHAQIRHGHMWLSFIVFRRSHLQRPLLSDLGCSLLGFHYASRFTPPKD